MCDMTINVLGTEYTIEHKNSSEDALMFESGLAENWEHKNIGQEETVVDWFAIQGLKIYNAWKQADCI